MPVAWRLRKGQGGRKKKIKTKGYFCPSKSCEYYGISEEYIHSLVGYGKHDVIQDFKCQGRGKKFTARRNTVLYRLNSHSGLIEKILWLVVLGMDASELEEKKISGELYTSFQHEWLEALFLCSDRAFWEMGNSGGEEASLGAIE